MADLGPGYQKRREAFLRALGGWDPENTRRTWKPRAPAYGLHDAPAASRQSSHEFAVNPVGPLPMVGLEFEVSPFDPGFF